MATLPADRTKLALAQGNQVPNMVIASAKNINSIVEAYDTVDLLNQKVDANYGTGAIGTNQLADNSVTLAKMADNSVGTTELVASSVSLAKMAAASVGTPQLVDGSVTNAKIASGVITADKFVAGALNNDTQNGLLITALSADFTQKNSKINIKIDNATNLNRKINGVDGNGESGHYLTYDYTKAFNDVYVFSDTADAWLTSTATDNPWIKFNMPVGVVIGDSISAGNLALYGRLYNSIGAVDLTLLNSPGQFSYHLEQFTRCKVYNHGIPGQTADQVRSRWNRDVLAQTDAAATPTSTLPKKPAWVFINVGVNDIATDRTFAQITADMEFMIDSAIANDIYPVMNNIASYSSSTPARIDVMKHVNSWLLDKEAATPELKVMDWYTFMNDPNNDGKPKSGYTSDGTHPYKNIYEIWSREIIEQSFTAAYSAVVPRYINFSTRFDPINLANDVDRPTSVLVYINDIPIGWRRLSNSPDQSIELPLLNSVTFIDTVKIEISSWEEPLEQSGTGTVVGFAEIYLTDIDLFPERMYQKDFTEIVSMPSAGAGVQSFFPAKFNGSGSVTYTSLASDIDIIGIFAVTSTATNTYIAISGICQAYVDGTVMAGDILVTTSTTNQFTRSDTFTAGSKVAKVLKGRTGAGFCLVELL